MQITRFMDAVNNYAEENGYEHPKFVSDKRDNDGEELVILKFDKTILYKDRNNEDSGLFNTVGKIFNYSTNVNFDDEVKPQHIANMQEAFHQMMPGVVQEIRVQKEKGVNPFFTTYKDSKKVRGNDLGTQEASIRIRVRKSTIEKMDETAMRRFAMAMDVAASLTDIDPNAKVTEEKSAFRKFMGDKKNLWGYNQANLVLEQPVIENGVLADAANTVGTAAVAVGAVAIAVGAVALAVLLAKEGIDHKGKAYKKAGKGKYFGAVVENYRGDRDLSLAGDVLVGGVKAAAVVGGSLASSSSSTAGCDISDSEQSMGLATKATIAHKVATANAADLLATTTTTTSTVTPTAPPPSPEYQMQPPPPYE